MLWILGEYLSVPATVGFIALLGIAVQNGIVMITFINELKENGIETVEAIKKGSMLRLRPILMTSFTTLFGLIPLLMASGVGADVQRPLAAVVVGGLLTSVASTLFLLPVFYPWFPTNYRKEK
jgi:cobalt-zinc-cadmium resistance protein CzcA